VSETPEVNNEVVPIPAGHPMGEQARADLAKLVDRCHDVPPTQRSIWHNAVLLLWEQVIYLEEEIEHAGSGG
jgi:hypothetical protein